MPSLSERKTSNMAEPQHISPDAFLSKRYAALLALFFASVSHYSTTLGMEPIYASWRRQRPSRTTFTTLIDDLHDLGWIETAKSPEKRSAYVVHIRPRLIRYGLMLPSDLDLSGSWIVTDGTFDISDLVTSSARPE